MSDDKLLINNWFDRGALAAPDTAAIYLEAGKRYDLKLEYFEGGGQAVCRLCWTHPGQAREIVPAERLFTAPTQASTPSPSPREAHGLLGLYFNSTNLSGRFVAVTNATIDFDWGASPPRNGIGRAEPGGKKSSR